MNELGALQAIASRLAVITIDNGYSCDAGETVFQLRDAFTLLDQAPYIGVRFDGRDSLPASSRFVGCPSVRISATFELIAVVALGEDNGPERPLLVIDDIDRALFGLDGTAVMSAAGLTLTPGIAVVQPADDGDALTEITVTVTAEFTKSLSS